MKDAKASPSAPKKDVATQNELGEIKVHENVIGDIVRKATSGVDGVVKFAGNSLVDSIADIVHSRKIGDRSIGIEMNDDSVSVAVKVCLVYGKHIPTVAANVQAAIKEQVEKIAGMKVKKVDVIVQSVLEEGEDEEEIAANVE